MLRREGMRKSRERSTGKLRQNEVYWGLERQGVVGPSVCDTSTSSVTDRMKRLYEAGAGGAFRYGEGEYVHPDPAAVKLARSVGVST